MFSDLFTFFFWYSEHIFVSRDFYPLSSKQLQGINPGRGFLPTELKGITICGDYPPWGFLSLDVIPSAAKLGLRFICEEPPKLSRLNQVIVHWSTQFKRDNPGSPRYVPWVTPRINSHTIGSRHSNHHKDTYQSKILNFWLQVLFILQSSWL